MSGPIVYVEDEPNDAFFLERALKQIAPEVKLKVLTNGQEAIKYFSTEFKVEWKGNPGLVLLDLNLPGRSGFEVLEEIRKAPPLATLPVIMFTSSNQAVDIKKAYERGCSGYLVKPRSADKLKEIIGALTEFWIKENQYPAMA